jgi:hypothetical protein
MEDNKMSDPIKPTASISLPEGFRFGEVPSGAPELEVRAAGLAPADPPLGPLVAFVREFVGNGFNTIFRPDSVQTPTKLPVTPPPPPAGIDNILELNLTTESLAFSQSLGTVPNRGTSPQGDIKLNGVPYLQTITDVTSGVGIHVEPGLWMAVPKTSAPAEGPTLVRMASIPHGTTITAQGTSKQIAGKPTIPAVNITPFIVGQTQATGPVPFPSQTATNKITFRIPQDLTTFIAANTITQAILDDPNTVLRDHIAPQTITATTQISISTNPAAPLFGGGADNIAFLEGDPASNKPNAQAFQMDATFWIETVEEIITVPIFTPGHPPLTIKGATQFAGQLVPSFLVQPTTAITAPRPIKVTFTQIQYSQVVMLKFNGLNWPHASVATLVPKHPIPVPASALA